VAVLIGIDFVFHMQMLELPIVREKQECSDFDESAWHVLRVRQAELGTLCILINVVVTQGCSANGT
jgi:hypothetical protein